MTMLLVLFFGYVAFAATFTVIAWKIKRHAKLIGLVTIALSAPFFYWLGGLSEQFTSGLCYSSAIQTIAAAVENTTSPTSLAEQIRALPLHGYETNCRDLALAAGKLPNAGAP